MPRAQFKRVVVGVADVGLQRIAAERGTQRTARSAYLAAADRVIYAVFATRSTGQRAWRHFAGLAQAQAQCRIAGISLHQNALPMGCRADVVRAENGLRSSLTLHREHPLLRVRSVVVNVVSRNGADRF